jgi:hypothetical protein
MKKSSVQLHKYFKRIIALTKNKDQANSFKKLMTEATLHEKNFKENSRKTKEKNTES